MEIIKPDSMSSDEAYRYIRYIEQKYNKPLKSIEITFGEDEEDIELRYLFRPVPFERIRRITGYLTGDTSNWNDAKQQEEKDRRKHAYCTV